MIRDEGGALKLFRVCANELLEPDDILFPAPGSPSAATEGAAVHACGIAADDPFH